MLEKNARTTVRVVLSLGLVASGLFILIANNSNPDLEKAAIGWVAWILGYWMK